MMRLFASAAGALLLSATLSQAQPATSATAVDQIMIRVDVTGIAGELAGELGMAADQVPLTVELPVEAAAEVCEFDADELALLATSDPHIECQAASVSPELVQAAGEQIDR
jgi:hypothetical protein